MDQKMSEEGMSKKFSQSQIAFQRQAIQHDLDSIQNATTAALGLIHWAKVHPDAFGFFQQLCELDDQKRFNVWDDPVVEMFNAIMDTPELLFDMMLAYTTVETQRQGVKLNELTESNLQFDDLADKQGKMINRLRRLVAPSKLKKFDAENRNGTS